MRHKIFNFLILVLLVLPLFNATTPININTFPDHRISIIIREAGQLTTLESFHKSTGNGNVSVTTAVGGDSIDIIVTLKKDGQNILNRKFEGNPTGEPIFINFFPGGEIGITVPPEPEINETEEASLETNDSETSNNETNYNEEIVEDEIIEETSPNSKLTGFAITSKVKSLVFSKTTYYIIGGIILLIIISFIVLMIIRKNKKRDKIIDFKIRDTKSSKQDYDKEIYSVERKIREAQEELEGIKNQKSKLREVRERFEKDKAELKRLGGLDY